MTHRQDLQQQVVILPKLLAGEIESFSTEKRYIRKDGTIVWATMWGPSSATGTAGQNGLLPLLRILPSGNRPKLP
jgi:hypothetical protein